jgi:hypothetical protein
MKKHLSSGHNSACRIFSYEAVLDYLVQEVRASFSRQIRDKSNPAHGAFLHAVYAGGYPSADHVGNVSDLVKACQVFLAPGSPLENDAALLQRIRESIAFQRRWQRPSGLIDLMSLNIESPPDTGFSVELCAAIVAVARKKPSSAGARLIAQELGEFIRTAAQGMIGRGFHTPNHRWVVCSALSQAMALFPELPAREYVESILAEGVDIQADGEYTERSTGIYNAVCNRAFRFMADALCMPELLDPVRKNLDFMTHVFHDDGSVVTSISNRQDQGLRVVPLMLADSFFDMAQRDSNGVWATVADSLFEHRIPDAAGLHANDWLLQPFLQHPEYQREKLPRQPMPDQFAKHFPASGVWRVKRGPLSATAATENRTMFAVNYGRVQLKSVKISGAYFGTSNVRASAMSPIANGVRLINQGALNGFAGYVLPLGKPVPFGEFYRMNAERKTWLLPELNQTIDIVEVKNGFDLHLKSEGGLDRVPMEIECAFDGPGEWETDGSVVQSRNGHSAILKSGHGTFRNGDQAISVGPGSDIHRDWSMRYSAPIQDAFRVLITFQTPFDRTLEIRYGLWSLATRGLVDDIIQDAGATERRPDTGEPDSGNRMTIGTNRNSPSPISDGSPAPEP